MLRRMPPRFPRSQDLDLQVRLLRNLCRHRDHQARSRDCSRLIAPSNISFDETCERLVIEVTRRFAFEAQLSGHFRS